MKIKSVTITAMPRPMPDGMFNPMPESSFVSSEFIGHTEEEACDLFQRRERAYLRS